MPLVKYADKRIFATDELWHTHTHTCPRSLTRRTCPNAKLNGLIALSHVLFKFHSSPLPRSPSPLFDANLLLPITSPFFMIPIGNIIFTDTWLFRDEAGDWIAFSQSYGTTHILHIVFHPDRFALLPAVDCVSLTSTAPHRPDTNRIARAPQQISFRRKALAPNDFDKRKCIYTKYIWKCCKPFSQR